VHDLDKNDKNIDDRIPHLEIGSVMAPRSVEFEKLPLYLRDPITLADNMTMDKPRLIKTHMPFEFLPPKLLDSCKGLVKVSLIMLNMFYTEDQ
jgi:hypothetical protein